MIKNIKLMLVAALAMLSMNTMAQTVKATETFTYTVDGSNATITGFVNNLTATQMETLTIPATVKGEGSAVYNVTNIGVNGTATKFNGNTNIKKVTFEANSNLTEIAGKAFEGCSALTEIDLTNAKRLTTIGASAFAGTAITKLNFTTTRVADLTNFEFCDAGADGSNGSDKAWQKNATLTEVVLWDQWTAIGAAAFTNCTKLAKVNFQTANEIWLSYVTNATQTIAAGAFVGTAIENIDLSGTIVKSIPAGTFKATDTDAQNTALKTVKLNGDISALNANFNNSPNLTSINIEDDAALIALVANEFQYDTKLTSINLKNITNLSAASIFQGTGLTSVTIPAGVTTVIGQSAFQDCADLATVTFADRTNATTFAGISSMAFAGDTKLTTITLPTKIAVTEGVIAEKAFFLCTGLKSVTYKPTATASAQPIDAGAFSSCNNNEAANLITIYTTESVKDQYSEAPTCTKFDTGDAQAYEDNTITWEKAKYAKADKYYVKVGVPQNNGIKVKAAAGTKVYEAYLDQDATNGGTMNMIPYMVKGGYYYIGSTSAKSTALIVTDNANIAYEAGAAATPTSVLSSLTSTVNNALVLATAPKSVTTILADDAQDGQVIYGWVNAESVGTGWMKINSGTIPAKGLYILAKESAAGARLTVNWLDEDGNIEATETTGIQETVKNVVENGKVFNLAGQEVDGNYKGVVIKNGKKMIQK